MLWLLCGCDPVKLLVVVCLLRFLNSKCEFPAMSPFKLTGVTGNRTVTIRAAAEFLLAL